MRITAIQAAAQMKTPVRRTGSISPAIMVSIQRGLKVSRNQNRRSCMPPPMKVTERPTEPCSVGLTRGMLVVIVVFDERVCGSWPIRLACASVVKVVVA